LPKPGAAAGTYADSHFGSPEPPHANPTPKEAACCAVVPTTNEQPTAMVPDSAAIRSASSAGLSSTPDISVEPAMPAAAPTAPTAMDRLCPPPPQGFAVDSHGCLTEQIATIPEVRFAPNTSRLTAEAVQILTQFAEALVQQPQFFVEVDGNTDSSGSQYANLELSRQRAKAVKDTLIAHGVAAQRLSAEGYGSFRPLTNNATEQEREQNRRIDFRITAAP
jgi:outer membrane protein OmpA-like peptidoglycan-associated protein